MGQWVKLIDQHFYTNDTNYCNGPSIFLSWLCPLMEQHKFVSHNAFIYAFLYRYSIYVCTCGYVCVCLFVCVCLCVCVCVCGVDVDEGVGV